MAAAAALLVLLTGTILGLAGSSSATPTNRVAKKPCPLELFGGVNGGKSGSAAKYLRRQWYTVVRPAEGDQPPILETVIYRKPGARKVTILSAWLTRLKVTPNGLKQVGKTMPFKIVEPARASTTFVPVGPFTVRACARFSR